jgi:predicted phage terminase large subunit-like protein
MTTTVELLRRQADVQDALLKQRAEQSLRSFVEQAWPVLEPHTTFTPNWHLDYIAEHLEAVTAGEIRRLLINVPPRSMKSLLVSVLWPTWEWICEPGQRWIFASYADSLASKHSLDRRTVLQSPWYRDRWGSVVQLATDQNEKQEFQNTRRGVMVATSIGASVTGKGGNRIVVDDPHQPHHVESAAQREAAITYFRTTLSTRLDDKKTGAIVVVMQRLHERDLSAFVRDLDYTHIDLPAEAERPATFVMPRSGRTIKRATGDVLWPAREGLAELAEQRRLLGSAAYAAQYQQQPAPDGGQIFKPDWWRYYDELPSKLDEIAQSWDMAFKGTTTSDYVVGLVAARVGADIYVMDRVKGQWEFSETCRQLERLRDRYPTTRTTWIEEAANGPAVIDVLGRRIRGIVGVQPGGGKVARAHATQPLLESGNIWLPNPRPHGRAQADRQWVDDFVYQCTTFPSGANDDDVDALTQLVAQWQKPRPTVHVWRVGAR